MTAYVMLPKPETALRVEIFKEFEHGSQAHAWVNERRKEGDEREFTVWSKQQYDEEYEKRVAPLYRR